MDRRILAGVAVAALIAVIAFPMGGRGGAGEVTLQGEGSTFLYPQIQAWAQEFSQRYPNITINYNPTGSGAGQSAFLDGTVDFAGSDPPLSRDVWQGLQGRVVQMPVVIGMVAVVYNVPGVGEGLKLDGETLARIYKGEVEYWDDPAIAELNPGVELPHERIIVVHRSDSSGTTQIFTMFLHKASPDIWPADLVGKTVNWPVDTTGRGVGGKGNQGVMEQVRSNEYSIGYVEYAYALQTGASVALIKNADGAFVAPSPEAAQEAAKGALAGLPESPLDDWSGALDAIVYASGEGSYPLTSWSFLFFYTEYSEGKAEAVKRFIEWINTEGQDYIVDGYVPIPEEVRQINLKALDYIKTG